MDRALGAIEECSKPISVLLDSGAFSAWTHGSEIDLDTYMEFCSRFGSRLWGYVSLDVAKNPEQTKANYKIMLKNGLRPFPVHTQGASRRDMDEFFESSPYVMCGGLKDRVFESNPNTARVTKIIKKRMDWAQGRKVHWFGQVREDLVKTFLPYSVDCSTWSSGIRYGKLQVYLGRGNWFALYRSRNLKNIKSLRAQIPTAVQRELTSAGFGISDLWNRDKWLEYGHVLKVNTKSWVRYIAEFRAEFGTRIFMAVSHPFGKPGGHAHRVWMNVLENIRRFA